ncbi:hypothetical protein NL676_034928 [Syzygium grande]|nr:hypothetical protein NL676_034928 [Syzygium grande]
MCWFIEVPAMFRELWEGKGLDLPLLRPLLRDLRPWGSWANDFVGTAKEEDLRLASEVPTLTDAEILGKALDVPSSAEASTDCCVSCSTRLVGCEGTSGLPDLSVAGALAQNPKSPDRLPEHPELLRNPEIQNDFQKTQDFFPNQQAQTVEIPPKRGKFQYHNLPTNPEPKLVNNGIQRQ